MTLGLFLLFYPIVHLIGYIPLIGGFLKSVVGFIIFLACLLICIPLFILTLAAAWVFYRPLVTIILAGIALIILGTIIYLNNKSSSETTST